MLEDNALPTAPIIIRPRPLQQSVSVVAGVVAGVVVVIVVDLVAVVEHLIRFPLHFLAGLNSFRSEAI